MNKADTGRLRRFGLMVGGIFAVIGLWPTFNSYRLWALILAGLLLISAFVLPKSLRPVYRLWMTIGHALGWINTGIILGGVFYGMFVPIGILMRLLGKDPMRRKFEPGTGTYRVVRTPRPGSHMTRQF